MSKKSILQKFQRGGVVLNLEPPGEILEQTLANLLSEYKYRVDSEREEREADKERRFREDIAVREMQMEERLSQADLKQRRDKMRQDEKQSLRDDVTTVLTSDMNLDEQKNLFDSWKLGDLSGEIDRKIGIRDTFSGKIDLLMKSGEATVDDIKKAKMPIMPYAGEDWADTGIARADNYAKNIVANDILDNLYANDDFKRLMGETAIPYDINSAASVLSTIPDMLDVYGKFNKEKVDVIKSMLSSLSEVSKDNPQAALDYYRVFADKLSELTGLVTKEEGGGGLSDVGVTGEQIKQEPPSLEDAEYTFTGPGGRTQTVQGLAKATQLYNAGWTYEQPRYNINLYGATEKSPPKNLVPKQSIVEGPDGKRYQYVGFERGELSREEKLSGLRGGELQLLKKAKNTMYLKDSEGKTISVNARKARDYQVVPGNFLSKPDDIPDEYWNRFKPVDKELISRKWYDLSEKDKSEMLNKWANE